MASIYDRLSFMWGPSAPYQKDFTYASKPLTGNGQIPLTRATNKTVLGKSGLLETREAGEIGHEWDANGNYLGALIEPAATNSFQQSETLTTSPWGNNGGLGIVEDATLRGLRRWKLTNSGTTGLSGNGYQALTHSGTYAITSGSVYTFSFYYEKGTSLAFGFLIRDGALAGNNLTFNSDLTFSGTANAGAFTNLNARYEDLGSNRYRIIVSFTAGSTTTFNLLRSGPCNDSTISASTANAFSYVTGFQFEAGSVATSYIPTVAASATRNADVCAKTGVSDLIGQESGTIVVEANLRDLGTGYAEASRRIFSMSDNSLLNRIVIAYVTSTEVLNYLIETGDVIQVNESVAQVYGKVQFILRYSSSGSALFINGTKVNEVISPILIPSMSVIFFGKREDSNASLYLNDHLAFVALFKEALTDTEIANLPRVT